MRERRCIIHGGKSREMRSTIDARLSHRTDHQTSWIDVGAGYDGGMRQDYAPGYVPHSPGALASWINTATEQLRMIELWLRVGHMLPTLEVELGHPVLRMTWVSPVERLHARPLDVQDTLMPASLRSYGRIDWVSETGPEVATPQPYSSGFHGTHHCSIVRSMSSHEYNGWLIYVPFTSERLSHIRRSSEGIVDFTQSSFSEVASALLLR